ncbi:Antitoxin ParD [Bordetella ansorpii]|uniref:Antitoxin ParD n=2 Tax=Bordetella ansorpii TaxID=288768 RepID=A0A157PML1_9BORD|nr:Antitoxin ParD [Bordetella ansorpii]
MGSADDVDGRLIQKARSREAREMSTFALPSSSARAGGPTFVLMWVHYSILGSPMSRLTIDVTDHQHQMLKARAALEGKTIKQYTLERLFPSSVAQDQAMYELKSLLNERLAEVERGEIEDGSITEITMAEMHRGKTR